MSLTSSSFANHRPHNGVVCKCGNYMGQDLDCVLGGGEACISVSE
jgi:hypothetical protein